MHEPQQNTLGNIAQGSIGPEAHIQNGLMTQEQVDTVRELLASGEFYSPVSNELRPNAPAGTFSLVVADALTTGRFLREGMTAKDHAKEVFGYLVSNYDDDESKRVIPGACMDGRHADTSTPSIVGDHDGDHGEDDCGAQKNLGSILGFIATHGDAIRDFLANIGVETDDETHQLLVANSQKLLDDGYVVGGLELREAYAETPGVGEAAVVHLLHNHGEIAAEINLDETKTLDRARLAAAAGDVINVFNVDAGVYPKAAAKISLTEREAHQKTMALFYYTVGTSAILGHSSLSVDVRQPAFVDA